ncbi:hypothetical protein [Helicobacter cynogastricus]|uniref:hypothetical protein n=1 Tax=Helicobacter cynogastricus TaxID=329937 RepID=UPI000CF1B0AE|nr:hypothetical protein [Helicobacter cynogastricus]
MTNPKLDLWLVPTIVFAIFCGILFSLLAFAFKDPDSNFQETGGKRTATPTELRKALEQHMH